MASNNHQNSRNVIQSEVSVNVYVSPEKEVSKVENSARDSERTAADTNSNSLRQVEIDPQDFANIDEDSLQDNYPFGNFINSETETCNGDIESVAQELGLDEIEPTCENLNEEVKDSFSGINSQSSGTVSKPKRGRPRKLHQVSEERIESDPKFVKVTIVVHKKTKKNPLLLMIDTLTRSKKPKKLDSRGSRRKLTICEPHPLIKNFRPDIVRYFKKCIRCREMGAYFLAEIIVSEETLEQMIQFQTEDEKDAVKMFLNNVEIYSDVLSEFAKIDSGPATEGQSYLKLKYGDNFKEKSGKQLSFNNTYCNEAFSNPIVYETYLCFVKALFTGKSCAQLCNFFKFSCCGCETHTNECLNKWQQLAEFTAYDLIFRKPLVR